ncbi:MAG: 2OG-Fe(II) oxygenase [Alcanivorax sp.]|nr:2OG-Fe(II) oxygenase [Alcanivorax sp.]
MKDLPPPVTPDVPVPITSPSPAVAPAAIVPPTIVPPGMVADLNPSEQIIAGLVRNGYAVVPDYLPRALASALRREAARRDRQGEFSVAAIGRDAQWQQDSSVRRDRTCWLTGESPAQQALGSHLEQLRQGINRALFLGLFDLEAHFAIYHPGAFYRRHLDAFQGNNARVVSMVLYLNPAWVPEHGGCLRLWPSPRARRPAFDVAPMSGTLVCFLSEQIPHEVLPAFNDRLSIACWFRRNMTTAEHLDPPVAFARPAAR